MAPTDSEPKPEPETTGAKRAKPRAGSVLADLIIDTRASAKDMARTLWHALGERKSLAIRDALDAIARRHKAPGTIIDHEAA